MRFWKKIFSEVLSDPLATCSQEKRAFVDDWFTRRSDFMAQVSFWLGIFLLFFGIFLLPPMIKDEQARKVLYFAFGYGLLNSPFWLYQVRKKPKSADLAITIGGLVALYPIAFIVFFFGVYHVHPANALAASSVIATLSFYYCAFSPLRNYLLNINSVLIFVAELIAFSRIMPVQYMIPLALLNQICGLIVAWTSIYRERHFAMREFDRQSELAAAHKAQQDHEIQLAEAIHESFSAESSLLIGDRWSVEIFRAAGERLGGDWAAFRQETEQKLCALIIDASGRGMQGALVVHAVQSLWASSLGEPHFSPKSWLEMLNTTLLRMGKKTLHTLTAAIAEISDSEIVLWSAGHCPAYIIEENTDQLAVRALVGGGSIVGLTKEFIVQPVSYTFTQGSMRKIVLGTDGALEPYMHRRRNNIASLLEKVAAEGAPALGPAGTGDDRTLVIIKPVFLSSTAGSSGAA